VKGVACECAQEYSTNPSRRGLARPQPRKRQASLADLVGCDAPFRGTTLVAWRMPMGLHLNHVFRPTIVRRHAGSQV